MAECRACLVKNVRMHLITDTRYREMFEKLTGKKLTIEDGRPETICYICNSQLQRFLRFFEMSKKTEKMLTTRLLFGIEMQGTLDKTMCHLTTTAVKAVSFMDEGSEAAPEVTVTVKEELEDADEWEQFKEEFMESPSDEFGNDDYEPTVQNFETEKTKTTNQDKEITQIDKEITLIEEITPLTNLLENAEERELNNELLDFIKTESIDNEETLNEENLNTEEFSMKTEDNLNVKEETSIKEQDPIKEEKIPVKADMRYHIQKTKIDTYVYCDKCEYRCQQSRTLRKHNRHHDPKNQFACTSCLYRFPDQKKLERHKSYCTVCNVCGKKFHKLNGLRIHVRLHTGEQPFSCDLCGRGFNQKTNLQTHLRVHAREKQYPCEICNKIFPFRSYLKRHMIIHSENNIDGESMHRIKNCHKLFSRKKKVMSSCSVCGKILRKDSMSMHMRLHTGEQPFSCEKCNRYFNQKCNLLTHVERCHPGDPLFACKVCFKTFAMNSELRKHVVTHGVKVEVKKELLAQTEKTIKKFISQYEKEVKQRMEVLTENDKKMELILNLGLKPRVINPQEPNSMIAILNLNEKGPNIKATKRKSNILDTGNKKAKRKATDVTILRDSMDGIVNSIKIEGFLPNNTKLNREESNSAVEKIKKGESILLNDSHVQDGQENDIATPENVTCTDASQELQRSDSKAHETSNGSKNNTEISNSLTTEDSPELNCIFVATNKDSNIETKNIKEVEIKRELITENEDFTENEVLLESVDKGQSKAKATIIVTNEVANVNVVAEEVSIKNELGDFEYCNDINNDDNINKDDIEYFDDSIEIVEVEISDSEEYTNLTEQNAKDEENTFTNKDLEVTEINLNQNALAGTEEKTNKEVLATEELEVKSQLLLSYKDDLSNEVARRQSISYTGVEVSVIDPDDLDDSVMDSEEENIEEQYLDISDPELIKLTDDNNGSFDEEEPKDAIIDLIDAKDKRDVTDTPQKLFPCNEPRIKLRSDLFSCHSKEIFKPNLNIEDNLGYATNRISNLTSDNNTTKDNTLSTEANTCLIANNDNDLEIKATGENHLDDYTDVEFLDSDSNYDHLESISTNEYKIDTLSTNKDNFDDINITDAEDISSDSNYGNSVSAKDFEVFQQKHITSVHRKINSVATPYPCDLCVTVFSY